MRWRRMILFLGLMGLLIGACGGDSTGENGTEAGPEPAAEEPASDTPTTTAAPEPTTTEAPDTTTTTEAAAGPEGVIVELTQGAALQPYGTEDITAGQVVLYWYRGTAGNYVAVYTGDGIAGAEGQALCPGNSIKTDTWIHISNAPSEDGACEWGPEVVGSLQVCDSGVWIYETVIPNDVDGELWGSLEWTGADGNPTGLTSITLSGEGMGEVEAGLASYSIPPWYTSDGATVINCGEPGA